MRTRTRFDVVAGTLLGVALSAATASAQNPAGIVTSVSGPVVVSRAALKEPMDLKFRDKVFLQDRLATGDNATTRILLGGRATLTIRERSYVTITETPSSSTIHLGAGKLSLAVVKEKMRSGDLIEIRTPNAVAGIRGTVVIAEVDPTQALRSSITVLRGLVDVAAADPQSGARLGGSTFVGALQSITIDGATLPAQPRSITQGEAATVAGEFATPLPVVTSSDPATLETQMAIAVQQALTVPVPGAPAQSTSQTQTTGTESGDSKSSSSDKDDSPITVSTSNSSGHGKSGDSDKSHKGDKSSDSGKGSGSLGGGVALSTGGGSGKSSGGSGSGGTQSGGSMSSAPTSPVTVYPPASQAPGGKTKGGFGRGRQ